MYKITFTKKTIFKISIPILLVILTTGIICIYKLNKTEQEKQENEVSLVHKSAFYKMMYEENDYDFIKTGEKELENIDSYIERYEENYDFDFFMKIQRDCLRGELNKKIYHLLLNNQLITEDIDYDSYLEQHPESILNLKNKGRILEYEPIDYINLFGQYSIDWNEYDYYLKFCENYSMEPSMDIVEQSTNNDAQNYFPRGTFHIVWNEVYSSFLDYFDPVSIMHLEKGQNEVRFFCIDSGMKRNSYSYLIKVTWTKFSQNMEVIVEDSPARHKKIPVTRSEIRKLLKLLKECEFYDRKSSLDVSANDANEYVCEVNINGKYKVVSRDDYPSVDPFMVQIQQFLVRKTGGAPNRGKKAWRF